MPVNKVVFGNTTILDLSQSTLSNADSLISGVTAFDRAGNLITGTASPTGSEWTSGIYQDAQGFIRVSPDGGAAGFSLVSNYLVAAI